MKDNSNLFIHRNENFIFVPPHCMENKNLTWTAKGIHAYLFSRANQAINFEDLKNKTTISMEEIKSAIKELITHNYLYKIVKTNSSETKKGYVIFDIPKDKEYALERIKNLIADADNWEIEEETK